MGEQQYTLLDNGTYQERLDILYPPGTVFYLKNANDDGYSPIVQESETEAATLPDVEITLDRKSVV